MSYNVVYIGNNAKACDYINCHEGFNVTAVICQAKMINDELLTCCVIRDLLIKEINNHADVLKELTLLESAFDFAIMLSFGIILKEELLKRFTVFNIHPSYLPKYKGKNCTFYMTMAGEKTAGITLHKVAVNVDEGDIISRKMIPFYYNMGSKALWDKLLNEVPLLLADLMAFLVDPAYNLINNNSDDYFKPVTDDMLAITENTPPRDILNLIRTQDSYNGVKYKYNNTYYIFKSAVVKPFKTKMPCYTYNGVLMLIENEPAGIKINEKYYLKLN